MSHFAECNIKAWEGADNPPPWCNCQTIAEVEIKAREDERRDTLAKCIEAVTRTPGIYLNLVNPNPPLRKFVDEMDVIVALRDLQDKP